MQATKRYRLMRYGSMAAFEEHWALRALIPARSKSTRLLVFASQRIDREVVLMSQTGGSATTHCNPLYFGPSVASVLGDDGGAGQIL